MKLLYTLIILSAFSFAEEKTFIREYTYQASDYDSKVTSRANSLAQVKRILLEEVSVFIKSEVDWTQTEELIAGKYELTDFYENKIQSITAGVTETIILDEKWTGGEYWIKAEITIDPDDIMRKVDKIIQNKEMLKELEGFKKKTDEALLEIARLKKELSKSKMEENGYQNKESERFQEQYNERISNLGSKGFAERGMKNYKKRNYEDAMLYIDYAIQLDPNDGYAHSCKCLLNDKLGKTGGSFSVFSSGSNLIDDGLGDCEKAIKLSPNDYRVYENISNIYNNNHSRYNEALKYAKKAQELNPNRSSFKSNYNLGVLYQNNKNYIKAIEYYNKSVEIYNSNYSDSLKYKKSYQDAINFLEKFE